MGVGGGIVGTFPPLARSDWLLADAERAVLVVLHGLKGRLTVNGATYSSMMAPLGAVADDAGVADVMNYVLNSWGNAGGWLSPVDVARLRREHAARNEPWRVEELESGY